MRHVARIRQEIVDWASALDDVIVYAQDFVDRLAQNAAQPRILAPDRAVSDRFLSCGNLVAAGDDLVQMRPFLDHRLADKNRRLKDNVRSRIFR